MIPLYTDQVLPSFVGFTVLDLETTTSVIPQAKIVSLAMRGLIYSHHSTPTPWLTTGDYYIELDPEAIISPAAAQCHGISAPKPGSPKFAAVAGQISQTLRGSTYIVGWGLNDFILPILNKELIAAGQEPLADVRTIDTRSVHAQLMGDPLTSASYAWKGMRPETQELLGDLPHPAPRAHGDIHKMTSILLGSISHAGVEGLPTAELMDSEGKIVKRDGQHWFTFGKHNRSNKSGLPIERIIHEDSDYISWLEQSAGFSAEFRTALIRVVNKITMSRQ